MADTIITNTPGSADGSGTAGLVMVIILIAAVLIGGTFVYKKGYFRANEGSTTNINVTVPDPITPTPAPSN